ncbi:MAG: PIN domain nuclease [Blastopirellula sp.]|nr:MAG: PIN domain nuclease [Blastopirellula sp.]
MNVLIDTTIWSLALRRQEQKPKDQVLINELSELIEEMRAEIIGPIRQELLSGIAETPKFKTVKQHLQAFDDLPITSVDYEEAARLFNVCRKKGVQGSHVDFLICAVAIRLSIPIFTTDKDFANYSKHLKLKLHTPRIE